MRYFRIQSSINEKHMGKIPQVKEVIYNGDVEAHNFVDRVYYTKVDFEPVVANPVLHPKAILTDLIAPFGMGSTFTVLISGKLKLILEQYRDDGMQFFQCSVFQNGIEYNDFWLLNMYIANNEYINYSGSEIILWKKKKEEPGKVPEIINISDIDNFNERIEEARTNREILHVKKISLKKDIKEDFFILRYIEGGAGYFVSEKLKKEMEDAGCTGIEFQSSELSYHEWVKRDGPRDEVYGRSW
ncbi:hypothetical protein E0W68_08460 [Flavobacterium salilacus subsp. salilacus]|uniref:imm11 family protein n=1 Tax=Flavobacterium TaxID=237 RepID=UPI001074FB2F|nr:MULTISPECIES: DUF1629 domain-containing protein [Flavobacterium]KAF2518771.1 hypothetical protein E0W68_08460 [Flavobacterium salilacus subsp. salilacus]MBE1613739.1 hypothetical protein [Flavobacterium sp. SaA2.13]